MNLNNFFDHLREQNCSITPIEGRNLSGIGLKITNNKNGLVYYLQLYKNATEVSSNTIDECCNALELVGQLLISNYKLVIKNNFQYHKFPYCITSSITFPTQPLGI